ncbi:hypothetical protein DYB25_012817 [Aphanomyces astaci]|uniref:non-specific serine/threonine protein kinase n=1 Tax=Aphanomyces astaci TaxID=112090 RepID=A0A397BPF2_APHAT|nr:hypothetical protein DYB25_012817 [Aphanomyces astaci]
MPTSNPRGSPVERHLRPARHDVHEFKLDHIPAQAAATFDRFEPDETTTPDADSIPVLCEKQVTIIVLLARVCTVYDATPKTFVSNVLRLHRLGIIDSIAFLADLGLLPTSPLAASSSPRHDFLEPWDADPRSLHLIPQTLNMSRYARDFDELCLLGRGGFGHVFKARHKLDGLCYAIKQVHFLNKGYQSPLVQSVLREVHCLARCDHPNVNRYYGAWLEPTWIPMGPSASTAAAPDAHVHMSSHDVSLSSIEAKRENRHLIEDIRRFVDLQSNPSDDSLSWRSTTSQTRSFAEYSETSSLEFDHSNFASQQSKYVFFDLKPSNVFMARDGSLKIGDFGLSKLLLLADDGIMRRPHDEAHPTDERPTFAEEGADDPRHTRGIGTMAYASPEQVAGRDYDVKVDSFRFE